MEIDTDFLARYGPRALILGGSEGIGSAFAEHLARAGFDGTLILNVKEEGLETRLLAMMAEHEIEDFFFLDQSFPFLVKTARTGERRCAVRVSEFESVDTALALTERAALPLDRWVRKFDRWPAGQDDTRIMPRAMLGIGLMIQIST